MKIFDCAGKFSATALLVAGGLAASSAQAGFVLTLETSSGDALSFIDDGDGIIDFSGDLGDFSIVTTVGRSKPALDSGSALLKLFSLDVNGGVGDTLSISITDTDYTGPVGGLTAIYDIDSAGMVDLDFLYDDTNAEFSGAAFASYLAPGAGIDVDGEMSSAVPAASPFSLTINVEIDHTEAHQVTNLTAEIAPVPLPASIWLMGTALAGLWAKSRIKKLA